MNKYILGLATLLAGAFSVASCMVEDAVEFPEIATKQAVYEAPVEGGEVTVAISSNISWTASVSPLTSRDNVDDVKVSIEKGTPATSELKVSFGRNDGYNRGAIITLTGRDASAAVTINQPGAKGELIESLTIAEFNAKPVDASIFYQISGTVTKIAQSNKYSNFYLNDGTAEVYVYGLYEGKGGPQYTDGWLDRMEVKVGYTMTIGATRGQYNATIEAMNAYPIEWAAPTTPMITCDAPEVTVGAAAGEATFAVTTMNLKSDFTVTPAESYDWITDYTKSGRASGNIVVKVAANEDTENARVAKFTVASEGAEPVVLTLTQSKKLLAGTLETPFTIEQAIEAANAGVSDNVYVKGIVSELVSGGFSASYGNGSFYMSADGVRHKDNTLDFEAYQVNYFNGAKWTADDPQIEVGSEVIIYGPLTTYNGLAETKGKGAAYVYSINAATTAAEGLGTQNKPFTVAGVIAAQKAGVSGKVYVEGIVSELYKGGFDAQYGNGSFYMSADGVRHKDNALDFEAYQVNYLENQKYTADYPQIAVGDKVIIYGPLTVYNGLVETQGKGAGYLYSLNGKTTIAGGDDQPGEGGGDEDSLEGETFKGNVDLVAGENSLCDSATVVNGVEDVIVLKVGSSKKGGKGSFKVPAGTKKVTLFGVSWKNTPATVEFKAGDWSKSVEFAANDGATSNNPYTLTVTAKDKYTLEFSEALKEETEVELSTKDTYRAIVFGVKAEK